MSKVNGWMVALGFMPDPRTVLCSIPPAERGSARDVARGRCRDGALPARNAPKLLLMAERDACSEPPALRATTVRPRFDMTAQSPS